jgi:hypothetical protein
MIFFLLPNWAGRHGNLFVLHNYESRKASLNNKLYELHKLAGGVIPCTIKCVYIQQWVLSWSAIWYWGGCNPEKILLCSMQLLGAATQSSFRAHTSSVSSSLRCSSISIQTHMLQEKTNLINRTSCSIQTYIGKRSFSFTTKSHMHLASMYSYSFCVKKDPWDTKFQFVDHVNISIFLVGEFRLYVASVVGMNKSFTLQEKRCVKTGKRNQW